MALSFISKIVVTLGGGLAAELWIGGLLTLALAVVAPLVGTHRRIMDAKSDAIQENSENLEEIRSEMYEALERGDNAWFSGLDNALDGLLKMGKNDRQHLSMALEQRHVPWLCHRHRRPSRGLRRPTNPRCSPVERRAIDSQRPVEVAAVSRPRRCQGMGIESEIADGLRDVREIRSRERTPGDGIATRLSPSVCVLGHLVSSRFQHPVHRPACRSTPGVRGLNGVQRELGTQGEAPALVRRIELTAAHGDLSTTLQSDPDAEKIARSYRELADHSDGIVRWSRGLGRRDHPGPRHARRRMRLEFSENAVRMRRRSNGISNPLRSRSTPPRPA